MNANTCPECGADMKHSPCCARLHAAFGGYYREYANMVAEQKRGGGL